MKKLTLLAIICQIASLTLAQVSTLSNTFFAPTDYIGWDATPGSPPLHIKTELNQPIRFYTDAGAGGSNPSRGAPLTLRLRSATEGTLKFVFINKNKKK